LDVHAKKVGKVVVIGDVEVGGTNQSPSEPRHHGRRSTIPRQDTSFVYPSHLHHCRMNRRSVNHWTMNRRSVNHWTMNKRSVNHWTMNRTRRSTKREHGTLFLFVKTSS
jgi:hypothetical protein